MGPTELWDSQNMPSFDHVLKFFMVNHHGACMISKYGFFTTCGHFFLVLEPNRSFRPKILDSKCPPPPLANTSMPASMCCRASRPNASQNPLPLGVEKTRSWKRKKKMKGRRERKERFPARRKTEKESREKKAGLKVYLLFSRPLIRKQEVCRNHKVCLMRFARARLRVWFLFPVW